MVNQGVIYRKTKVTLIRRVVKVKGLNKPFKSGANPLQEEFKYLNFGYTKAVSKYPNIIAPC
jgi:hypothetical protein